MVNDKQIYRFFQLLKNIIFHYVQNHNRKSKIWSHLLEKRIINVFIRSVLIRRVETYSHCPHIFEEFRKARTTNGHLSKIGYATNNKITTSTTSFLLLYKIQKGLLVIAQCKKLVIFLHYHRATVTHTRHKYV